jgi:chromosome segregation ATPase
MASGEAGNGKTKPSWVPTGKDGAFLLMLGAGTFGSYKLIDAAVERQITENATEIVALNRRIEQLDGKIAALQADRLLDLRTVFERGSAIQGTLDTLSRQLVDVKHGTDAVERRTADADRDLKEAISELRREVNGALRAPLVGPRGR